MLREKRHVQFGSQKARYGPAPLLAHRDVIASGELR
jgi:hypothetical protein